MEQNLHYVLLATTCNTILCCRKGYDIGKTRKFNKVIACHAS